jgi:hypothetical protein
LLERGGHWGLGGDGVVLFRVGWVLSLISILGCQIRNFEVCGVGEGGCGGWGLL